MKCLSLWEPWALLLVAGSKKVETRGWRMLHRGPLLIHAAKHWNTELYELCRTEPFKSTLRDLGITMPIPTARGKIPMPLAMPFGAIIGRVDVVDCFATEDCLGTLEEQVTKSRDARGKPVLRLTAKERAFGDYSAGRFAFLCANQVRYASPFPYRGEQGIFNVPDSAIDAFYAPSELSNNPEPASLFSS